MGFKAWRTNIEEMLMISKIPENWIRIRLFDSWNLKKPSGFPKDMSDNELAVYAENNN